MTTPRTSTMWEVTAWHPDKTEPYDFFCRYYHTEQIAIDAKAELARDGWEHIHIKPPSDLRTMEKTRNRER